MSTNTSLQFWLRRLSYAHPAAAFLLAALMFPQAGCLAPGGPAADSGAVAESPALWPLYHGDAGLCGVAQTELPNKPVELWRFKAGAGVSLPPVAGWGMIFFVDDNGEAWAVNMAGQKVWSASSSTS